MADRPLFVATWEFGQAVAEKALAVASGGHSMLDAIERGIWVAEMDATNATVGLGGTPNASGQVELDACIMSGPDHNAGCVAALQDILHPISVARKIMTDSKHVMLVGAHARTFAIEHGFAVTDLLTEKEKTAWLQWRKENRPAAAPHQNVPPHSGSIDDLAAVDSPTPSAKRRDGRGHDQHHDTIALVGIDENGDLYAGCSTSGWGYKTPGRVGDSPIIGSGLYVDNEIGAVGSTGTGENVMRWCASFWITQCMGEGLSPTEACEKVIREIARKDPLGLEKLAINFIAINKQGQFGGCGTSGGFQFATASPTQTHLHDAKILS